MVADNQRPTVTQHVIDPWRLGDLLASSGVGIWSCDLPFDVLHWDAKVKEHFWLPPDADVTIDLFYERLHPDDRERTRTAIDSSIRKRSTYDIEYRTVSSAGQIRWLRAIGGGFYNDSGQPIRFDGVTVDITAQKEQEQQ